MRRTIRTRAIIGKPSTATIVVDKDGMRVEDKSEGMEFERDSYFVREFIRQCIDMDSWQNSWHVDVGSALSRGSKERKIVRDIIKEKISAREKEIEILKDGLIVLGRSKSSF